MLDLDKTETETLTISSTGSTTLGAKGLQHDRRHKCVIM